MERLNELLKLSAGRHDHLCPRQVLGVRMGMLAGQLLGLQLPQKDKRLFTFAECDGCGTEGISVATGCWVDRRTLRVMDYGKLAASFVDTQTSKAIRIKPHPECRSTADQYAPDQPDSWHRQLIAYQIMLDDQLLVAEKVRLTLSLERIISQPGLLAICTVCGEEISNQREVFRDRHILCRACAGSPYYTLLNDQVAPAAFSIEQDPIETASGRNGKQPIPAITVVGKSGNGKTTLIEKMVRELSRRGYRVATVKHHSHRGFEIDQAGKDSWRHARAGSRHVIIAAPDKIASYRQLERELQLEEILPAIDHVDIILLEGYRESNRPTIEVLRAENSLETVGNPRQWIAIASDVQLALDIPQYDLNDTMGIVDLLESLFLDNRHPDLQANFYEPRQLYTVSG